VDVVDVTQAADDRQPPQFGTHLPDGIVSGSAATPGHDFRPRGRGGPFVFCHL
jgi:hypothetical protein